MNMQAVILSCALLLATPLFAREKTDVIVMKNDDHLTGQIKGLSAGVRWFSYELRQENGRAEDILDEDIDLG